jgi:hypothetical protein
MSHVFVTHRDPTYVDLVLRTFRDLPGIAEALAGVGRAKYGLDHERAGDVVLVSSPGSWQAYYWWNENAQAPDFAHRVDIHRKPGYDPVELFFDPTTKTTPLDATLVRGSHGAPLETAQSAGVLVASRPGIIRQSAVRDTDVAGMVLRQFGIEGAGSVEA